jgi:signal peptidase I
MSGLHWVGDLGVEAWIDIQSDQGAVFLETTKGGVHFTCEIDVASGKVILRASGDEVRFVDRQGTPTSEPTGQSSIRGRGSHRVSWMNADNRLFLWIDGRSVSFDGLAFQDYERASPVLPSYSEEDPGDALPLGIGCRSAKLDVSRIKVWRDVYYTSVTPEYGGSDYRVHFDGFGLDDVLDDPTNWNSQAAQALFDSQRRTARDLHPLGDGQYFPLGDNSPSSQDARLWGNPPYVPRELLLGRSLFLYWPHSLNFPFYGFPDFSRMKFIR